jgi:hypothetical protein
MTIPLQARLVDVTNLLIAKGSSFLLTVLLFAILSRGMDMHAFAEFGYWWSVGVMIGGVMIGGLGATLVRITTTHGSLRHLSAPLIRIGVAFASVSIVLWLVVATGEWHGAVLIAFTVTLFGVAMLAQTAVLSLLRAVEATKANLAASALVLAVVPGIMWVFVDSERDLSRVFLLLAIAFAAGTLGAYACGRASLAPLFSPRSAEQAAGAPSFSRHSLAFTATNIFSYAVMNTDFTLFRLIGTADDFATMATGKVYFERFVVPALGIFVGAISLRVLRHPNAPGTQQARLELALHPLAALGMLGLLGALTLGYWIFAHFVRGDPQTIAPHWVACAAAGYLLYSFNSILMDVLVVRRSVRTVLLHAAGFILLAGLIQASTIRLFGVPGWAIGWLVFNIGVTSLLSRSKLFAVSRLPSAWRS